MEYTSAQANKLLKRLNEELENSINMEAKTSIFHAAMEEDPETIRPPYDYETVQQEQEELKRKIRLVKHAINKFNVETMIPELGMTIDQALIYIPQLTARKKKLASMRGRLAKERRSESDYFSYRGGSTVLDYTYTNYDMDLVERDYGKVAEALVNAQMALDKINNSVMMEIDIQ